MPALPGHLTVTASIVQSHAAWLTEPFIRVEFTGLEHDGMPVSGSVSLTCDAATDLGRVMSDLAVMAETAHAAQIASYLSALSSGGR